MPRSGREARARLLQAAIDLYLERGFDAVTATEIAERAGVTERTYFRHFADKREVLFEGWHLDPRTGLDAHLQRAFRQLRTIVADLDRQD
jgi:AcrR family transcriptional regulator